VAKLETEALMFECTDEGDDDDDTLIKIKDAWVLARLGRPQIAPLAQGRHHSLHEDFGWP